MVDIIINKWLAVYADNQQTVLQTRLRKRAGPWRNMHQITQAHMPRFGTFKCRCIINV